MGNVINLSKYLCFDINNGYFFITSEAQNIIYREKNIISSYSGSNEWANHFACELIDLYSGESKYSYGLFSTVHENKIPEVWAMDKRIVINWLNDMKDTDWAKAAFNAFDTIVDTLIER